MVGQWRGIAHNVEFEAVHLKHVPAQPVFLVNTRVSGLLAVMVGRRGEEGEEEGKEKVCHAEW